MFDQAKADAVVAEVSQGTPLAVVCRMPGMPKVQTVRDWAAANPSLAVSIARARDDGADSIAANALLTARGVSPHSTGDVARDRLIAETSLKLLAKWDPKRYGDKLQVEQDTTVRIIVQDATREATPQDALHAARSQAAGVVAHQVSDAIVASPALLQHVSQEDPSP